MSHYAVAVITNDQTSVDELLAPYDEGIEVAPYICRTKKQIIKAANELGIECLEFKHLDKDKLYLAFGSFMLVENFIKDEIER